MQIACAITVILHLEASRCSRQTFSLRTWARGSWTDMCHCQLSTWSTLHHQMSKCCIYLYLSMLGTLKHETGASNHLSQLLKRSRSCCSALIKAEISQCYTLFCGPHLFFSASPPINSSVAASGNGNVRKEIDLNSYFHSYTPELWGSRNECRCVNCWQQVFGSVSNTCKANSSASPSNFSSSSGEVSLLGIPAVWVKKVTQKGNYLISQSLLRLVL